MVLKKLCNLGSLLKVRCYAYSRFNNRSLRVNVKGADISCCYLRNIDGMSTPTLHDFPGYMLCHWMEGRRRTIISLLDNDINQYYGDFLVQQTLVCNKHFPDTRKNSKAAFTGDESSNSNSIQKHLSAYENLYCGNFDFWRDYSISKVAAHRNDMGSIFDGKMKAIEEDMGIIYECKLKVRIDSSIRYVFFLQILIFTISQCQAFIH